MLKTKQNRSKLFNLVKLILFLGIVWVIYNQMSGFDENKWREFEITNSIPLILATIFVIPNIWIAYVQWRVTLNVVVPNSDNHIQRQSFFAGIVTGMLTPNMVGNFIGRLYYFERVHRGQITLFTLLSNYAQFIASLLFGWIAILVVGDLYIIDESFWLTYLLGTSVVFAYFLYFFIENLLFRIKRKIYFSDFKELLRQNKMYRPKILGLSLVRFMIFTMQFSLVLIAFGEEINLTAIMAIWQVYLLTMLVPSLFLGKIGVRESVALFVLAGIGMNQYSVLFASLIIWFINSLSPALLGLALCKNDKRNE